MKGLKITVVLALVCLAAPALAVGRPTHSTSQSAVGAWALTVTQAVPIARAAALGRSLMTTLPENVPLHIVVGLNMRDRAGADQYARRTQTPGDPLFHAFLNPMQFTAMFNPSRSQAVAVASYLQSRGFTNISIEPNNLLVTATASASRAAAAFNTSIKATMWHGKLIYGNVTPAQVPAQLHGLLVAVLGLNNAYQMSTRIHVNPHVQAAAMSMTTGAPTASHTPPPCLVVTPTGVCTFGVYGPKQYQTAYDACEVPVKGTPVAASVEPSGAGRPSTFCALVRVAQGWPLDEAIKEERKYGFGPDAEHKKQARFLEAFYARKSAGSVQIPRL